MGLTPPRRLPCLVELWGDGLPHSRTPRANAAPAEAARGTLKPVTIGHVRMPERSFIIVPDGNGKVPLALQPHVLKARVRRGAVYPTLVGVATRLGGDVQISLFFWCASMQYGPWLAVPRYRAARKTCACGQPGSSPTPGPDNDSKSEVPHGRADASSPDERGRDRRTEPAPVHPDPGRPGSDGAYGRPDPGHGRPRARAAQGARVHPDQAGWGRPVAHALVAGADPAQPALRHRHEGRRRVPDLLRAARRLRSRGQPGARPRGRDPVGGQRGSGKGRHDRHLAPEEERRLARRQAVQRRRRGVHVGVRVRPGHRRRDRGLVPRGLADRQGGQPRHQDHVHPAAALLGRRLLRQPRHDPAQARVRELQGRQVPGGAGELEARGNRRLPHRRTSGPATS